MTTSNPLAGFDIGSGHPHGSNILKKLRDGEVQRDANKSALILEVARRYVQWRNAATSLSHEDSSLFIPESTRLYQEYRDFLDDPRVDVFDSRGALQPSALEEFCYFLFNPFLAQYAESIAVGHYDVYQGLYFTSKNFREFVVMPTPQFPVGNLDFIIGKRVDVRLSTDIHSADRPIFIPAVAVECKTYLDRPRYIESDNLASSLKRGFPRCLYIVISEFLKLDLNEVNVFGSQIDKIYVFRRSRNVDRRIRRAAGSGLLPLHVPAIEDFYRKVIEHLTEDWSAPEEWNVSGILK